LERLAVGVYAGVYDFEILSHMVSRYPYLIYTQLKDFIDGERIEGKSPTRHSKFVKLANDLREYREENPDKDVDGVAKI
jgi:hypothetical protein